MSDRPINAAAWEVRALLDGRKTQRRFLMPDRSPISTFEGRPVVQCADGVYRSPPTRYKVGDRLWVREAWACHWAVDDLPPRQISPHLWSIRYISEGYMRPAARDGSLATVDQCRKVRPGMFMPRWASRLTLTVTEVRVQRLQDISEADAWAEGCRQGDPDDVGGFFPAEEPHSSGIGYVGWDCARDWYADLWEDIYGPEAWDLNPWVAAYTFTVERRNIDVAPAARELTPNPSQT